MEGTNIKSILLRYERISGQMINFHISVINFSPNTGAMDRDLVCQKLGIREVQDPGHYLGMPMLIGRQNVQAFQFIKDKVKQKLQGWRTKGISKARKITLLKTAAQSVPNF